MWAKGDSITTAVGHMIEALEDERLTAAAAWIQTVHRARERYGLTVDYVDSGLGGIDFGRVHTRLNYVASATTLDLVF